MIIQDSQDDIIFDFNDTIKNVMIKISGGIDSALCFYLLCKYIYEHKKDINIIPQTSNDWKKPYQINFSSKVLAWMKKEFPTVSILDHETTQLETGIDYQQGQSIHIDEVLRKYHSNKMPIQMLISGVNRCPPKDIQSTFIDSENNVRVGPEDDRSIQQEQYQLIKFYHHKLTLFNPLINIDKKQIAKLCEDFDLTETLFPITRSCENKSPDLTKNFTIHCEECWWCHERKWGFGKII